MRHSALAFVEQLSRKGSIPPQNLMSFYIQSIATWIQELRRQYIKLQTRRVYSLTNFVYMLVE